jgi:hypothetical protein
MQLVEAVEQFAEIRCRQQGHMVSGMDLQQPLNVRGSQRDIAKGPEFDDQYVPAGRGRKRCLG